ncbi:MAG: radical SAM protein [Bacteroidales bacterium]|nr:radical SAM protein [Bacteroidales bacterium]
MKKKILLVIPRNYEINFINVSSIIKMITRRSGGPVVLSLATIAALTPPEFEVKIIDEDLAPVDFNESFDIVGIGGFSYILNRAEEIAREFSKRGALIVCGGSPVSFSPERWRSFADVLFIGEAERTWPRFLEDYIQGKVKKEYLEKEKIDLSLSPVPDYAGYLPGSLKKYLFGIIQASRGCPYRCEFCSVHEYVGNKMRYKPVQNIIREVDQLYRLGKFRVIMLADDNFSGNRKKAKEILRALRDWNQNRKYPVSFVTQLSIEVAGDEEFLELSADAGLTRVSVGVETPNLKSLEETNKKQNLLSDMLGDIKRFHEHGIMVHSGCIVGFDNDDLSIFKAQNDFFAKSGISNIQALPLQAPDGSPLKRRMIKEGRYIDYESTVRANPEHQNSLNTFTIVPKQMTLKQLEQGLCWLLKNLYEPGNYIHRLNTFFENYENSPKRKKLKIPKPGIDLDNLLLTARLMRYVIGKASQKERKLFWEIYRIAMGSSHPNKMYLLVNSYLSWINTQNILHKSFSQVDLVAYPQ